MTSSGDLQRRPSIRADEAGTRLSRGSHVPLYYQLAVILENRVEAGRYPPENISHPITICAPSSKYPVPSCAPLSQS